MSSAAGLVLPVFYLFLALRQKHIKRLGAFRVGLFAMFLLLLAKFLEVMPAFQEGGGPGPGEWIAGAKAAAIVAGFLAGVTACSPRRLRAAEQSEQAHGGLRKAREGLHQGMVVLEGSVQDFAHATNSDERAAKDVDRAEPLDPGDRATGPVRSVDSEREA